MIKLFKWINMFCFLLLIRYSFIALIFISMKVNAQDPKVMRVGIITDQDMFIEWLGLKEQNKDQNYTMGAGFFISNNKWANNCFLFWPTRKIGTVLNNKKWYQNGFEENATIQVGITGFTPRYLGDNLRDSLFYIVNDRPFSNLTFLSTKYHLATDNRIENTQIVIGVIGWGLAGRVQTHIHKHKWFGSTREIPYGWKYQISNGGALTALLTRKVDILMNEDKNNESGNGNNRITAQFIFSKEARVGYYIDAAAGFATRIGLLDLANWGIYDNYQLNYASDFFKQQKKFHNEFYLQASFKPRLVLYNALLMGQGGNDFHVFNGAEINHIILESFVGAGATITNYNQNFSTNLMIYLSSRTSEFKSELPSRSHIWGGVQVTVSCIKYKKS